MKKNIFYFVLSLLMISYSFNLDLAVNVKGSAEIQCLFQEDSLSVPIAVPKDIDHSEESHHRDRDWEMSVAS